MDWLNLSLQEFSISLRTKSIFHAAVRDTFPYVEQNNESVGMLLEDALVIAN